MSLVALPAAAASSEPRLLSVQDVPTEKRFDDWQESRTGTGLRSADYCHESAFPKKTVQHKAFYNDDEGNVISQFAVRMPTRAAAANLQAALNRCTSKAFGESQPSSPGVRTAYQTLANLGLADGLVVRAQTGTGGGFPRSVYLSATGRDGRYVTHLTFPLETKGSTPAKAWVALSKKALKRVAP